MADNLHLRVPVTIIGGGLVGLALGIALAQDGLESAVVEKEPLDTQLLPEFDGRVCALSLGSIQLMENLGVWPYLQPHAQPINDILVRDDNSPTYVHYDHQDIGDEPMGYIVENRHIRQALQQRALEFPLLRVLASAEWADIRNEAQQAVVTLKDAREIRSQLLVAADSRYSRVRQLAGIESITSDYKQTAIVVTISHEKPHLGLAIERFFAAGPFAVLPMTGNRSSLVWVEPPERAKAMLTLSAEALEEQIQQRVGDIFGKITIEGNSQPSKARREAAGDWGLGPHSKTKIFSYPLQFVLPKQYFRGRIVLAGDAAHGMHPIAGQGVNLGYRDVAALSEVLVAAAKRGQDLGSSAVLHDYQQWRSFDSLAMLTVTDGLTRLFSNNQPVLKAARNLGLGAVERLPLAKTFFMKHAMGVTGDLPPLLRKKAG